MSAACAAAGAGAELAGRFGGYRRRRSRRCPACRRRRSPSGPGGVPGSGRPASGGAAPPGPVARPGSGRRTRPGCRPGMGHAGQADRVSGGLAGPGRAVAAAGPAARPASKPGEELRLGPGGGRALGDLPAQHGPGRTARSSRARAAAAARRPAAPAAGAARPPGSGQRRRSFGKDRSGASFPPPNQTGLPGCGRVAGQADRVPGHLARVVRAVPQPDLHARAGQGREELRLGPGPGRGARPPGGCSVTRGGSACPARAAFSGSARVGLSRPRSGRPGPPPAGRTRPRGRAGPRRSGSSRCAAGPGGRPAGPAVATMWMWFPPWCTATQRTPSSSSPWRDRPVRCMISAAIRIHAPSPRSGSPGAARTAQCHTGSAGARSPSIASGCSISPVSVPEVRASRRAVAAAPARPGAASPATRCGLVCSHALPGPYR